MANTRIRVGHACYGDPVTKEEKHSISGGKPGDQGYYNGNNVLVEEVRIDPEYNITSDNFSILLRPISPELAKKSAKACEAGCKNQNIGYDQNKRTTLYDEAKKVNFDLSKITTPCCTDCSAFMSTCAIAGGATVSKSCTTATIANGFISTGDYEKFEKSAHAKYFNSVDFLKRGDILVKPNGHALMILGESEDIDVFAIKPIININNITHSSVDVSIKIFKVENGVESILNDINKLNDYNYRYELKPLSNTTLNTSYGNLIVNSSTFNFQLKSVLPGTVYSLKIIIKEKSGQLEFSSSNFIFTIPKVYPTAINNLNISFDLEDYSLNKKCLITFNEPNSWGSDLVKKGYRVCLIVNGKLKAFNDNLLNTGDRFVSKFLTLSDIAGEGYFTYNDVVQIGILPFVEEANNVVYDSNNFRCSDPVLIKPYFTIINKEFINIKNSIKRLILYNMQEVK